jgi:hypothetical protein
MSDSFLLRFFTRKRILYRICIKKELLIFRPLYVIKVLFLVLKKNLKVYEIYISILKLGMKNLPPQEEILVFKLNDQYYL